MPVPARFACGVLAPILLLLASMSLSCALPGLGSRASDAGVDCGAQRGSHASLAPAKHAGFPSFCADVSHSLPTLPFQVCDSTSADLNGDGRLELLAADHIQPAFGYFVNHPRPQGSRVFDRGVRVPFIDGANSAGIVAADYNGDGRPDVANSNHPGSVTIRINQTAEGSRTLRFPKSGETDIALDSVYGEGFGIAGKEGGLVSADFNGDGRPDIATADLGQTKQPVRGHAKACPSGDRHYSLYTAAVMLNTSDAGQSQASFGPTHYFPIPGPAISLASADFNRDGKMDLVTTNTGDSSISVLTNHTENGAPAPCFARAQTLRIPAGGLPQGAGPTNPIAADLNGDGAADIATANWNIRTVTVWLNTTPEGGAEQPSFSEVTVIPTGDFHPLVLRHGDLDGDGLEDIVAIPLSTLSRTALLVLRNATAPAADEAKFVLDAIYDLPDELANGWLYSYFASAGVVDDFDGDGRDDVALVIARASSLIRMMKPGNDILKFVDPGVPLALVHPILPHHSKLVMYRQMEGEASAVRERAASAEEAKGHDDPFCARAREVLGGLGESVAQVGALHEERGLADAAIRSAQAAHSAERLRAVAAAGSGEVATDLARIADYVDEMSAHVLEAPSKHPDHDVEEAVVRATQHLEERCGD